MPSYFLDPKLAFYRLPVLPPTAARADFVRLWLPSPKIHFK